MAGASFGLRPLLARGKPLVFPWMGIPGAELAAQVARAGFEAVAIDLQHSTIDMGDAAKMTNAINAVGVPVILRVRWNDPGIIGAALDMGAAAVIAPMTNSVAQVEALVKAAKYPPVGQRSWGGYTMLQAAGVTAGEYLKEANSQTLVFAMIETQEALDNLDAIAAVPGLDGLFVGPSDLSIALSNGAGIDRLGAHTIAAMKKVAAACQKHNLVAGAFAGTQDGVKAYAEIGFRFLAGPTDTELVRSGAAAFLKSVG
ncbi:MAG: aldolase/citrate lyase family protein [Hyphomicrobiales bacterium]